MTEDRHTFELTLPVFFDAAHQLPDSPDLVTKKCARLHGHTYHAIIKAEIAGNTLHGMVIDFKELKDGIADRIDHRFVNDVFDQHYGQNTKEATAENIALFLTQAVADILAANHVTLRRTTISLAEGYKGPENTVYVTVQERHGRDDD